MGKLEAVSMTRRHLLIASAGALLTFRFANEAFADTTFAPTNWFTMDADGIVTVNIIRAEMGQHVGTAIARILADELEVEWKNVRIVHVDTDPKWGLMVTGGSWSVWQSFPIYSQAGAAGRITLIEQAARLLGVDAADCKAQNGSVTAGAKTISYADILKGGTFAKQYSADELAKLPIKPAAERQLIGKPVLALDIAAKINGSALYGIDAKIDGMVYARPIIPPTRYGSKANSFDDSAAKAIKSYVTSIILDDPSGTVPGWVMVIAENYYAAQRAADLVKVDWTPGPTAKVSEKDIQDHAISLIAKTEGGAVLDTGGGDTRAALTTASTTLEQTYTTSTVLHFQLEPVNALAFEKDGVFEIHTGNQWQSLILPQLAVALGRPETSIIMRTYRIGGGFGRRLNGDYAIPAALASKALGKPVKMVLTRADDSRFDSVRSPSTQTLRMGFDAKNKITAMEHEASAGWPTQAMAAFFMPKAANGEPYDPFAISGADHWYDVGAQKVRAISNDVAMATFRPGWLRSVGPGWTNWALESFMDEAAYQIKADPVAFRLSLLTGAGRNAGTAPNSLGGAKRQAEVVARVAKLAKWDEELPADTAVGIATSFGQERDMPTWVACVARVFVDRTTGLVTVQKLTVVTDAGTIIDPDSARAQTEGAVLWGLSMALHEGTTFENGEVNDTNLDSYTPLVMSDVPELEIAFVESVEVPVGIGEPATTVVAPAIANAVFAATGVRLRHLPMTSNAVLAALQSK
jgi:isoquinoline 1-oxidoreductase beta subunit